MPKTPGPSEKPIQKIQTGPKIATLALTVVHSAAVHSAVVPSMSGVATSPPSAAADDAKEEEAAASLTKAEKSVRELSPCGRYERTDEELGSGSYKKVWKAYDTEEGYMVAWNTVRIGGFSNVDKKRILNEIKTLRILTEKEETKRFIVNLHHSCKSSMMQRCPTPLYHEPFDPCICSVSLLAPAPLLSRPRPRPHSLCCLLYNTGSNTYPAAQGR